MADEIVINANQFFDRLGQFYTAWKAERRQSTEGGLFNGASSIVVLAGKAEQESSYQKNNALHFWLLGYEFPATLMVFTMEAMYIVTTKKKAEHLKSILNGKIPVEVLTVDNKKPETKEEAFTKCIDKIKGAGKKVGTIAKSDATGPFADDWKKAFGDISKEVEEVDIAPALSLAAFATKDETELRSMRTAARACSGIMSDYWIDEMADVLDSGKTRTHKTLTQAIDAKIDDAKLFKKMSKLPSDFDAQQLEWAYGPVVQSGGKYDFKFSAQSDDSNLHSGVIVTGLGLRYKTYCSTLARTFLIDPSKSQSTNYKILLAAHETAIREAKDGVAAKDVYNKALGVIKSKKPDLEKSFGKNVGAAIGIELKDNSMVLNGKNSKALKDGMTLGITTSLENLQNDKAEDKKSGIYSLFLSDTIRVTRGEAVNFTKETSAELDSIEFYFNEDEAEPTPKKEKKEKKAASSIATANIKSARLRGAARQDNHKEEEEARRREHQKELASKKQKQGMERYKDATGDMNGTTEKKFKKFESYKQSNQFPPRVRDLVVYVDVKASTVILPIMGRPVPFHINTIKNVSMSEEGEYTLLRFNFMSPGQGVGRKDDQPFEDASAHFIRSLTVRSKDHDRMKDCNTQITELKKSSVRKEQEKKDMEDVVIQEKIVEVRNRRPIVLNDVYVRPAQDGKRVPGFVSIQQNGLRYSSLGRSETVDVVFSNIKHLFFQPCVGELIVVIHVHLKDPIIIGKRKTKDVQFYREATEMAFDETGNRKRKHRYGDDEEFEAEQEERRKRAELDKIFKRFAEQIADASKEETFGVDIPFREVAFNGVPNRSNVLMAPTTDALVQLTEPPFTVITLEEIEIAHLERIQFGLKNFDLVFVYKDFHRAPIHINTIPVESLDRVKEWLDSVDIAYTEGPLNLNWPTIMKTVTADPHQFFKDGGWSFLATDSDDEGSDESEVESAFEVSDEELAEASESSEDDSDFDDDASEDEGEEDSEMDDEGEDWDEMEMKAKRADRETNLDEEEDKKARKRKR